MKTKTKEINIEPISISSIKVKIVGVTPLLMDRFPDEAKEQILAKQTGISKSNKKKIRDTKTEITNAIHVTSLGKIGFPADAFKKGMIDSTSFVGDKFFSKKLIQGIKIINIVEGLVLIKFKKQDVLEHNIGHNTKFSPQFHNWSCELEIKYDSNNLTPRDIITLINYAGFYVGVGMWRPKGKDGGTGNYGMYEVEKNEKI